MNAKRWLLLTLLSFPAVAVEPAVYNFLVGSQNYHEQQVIHPRTVVLIGNSHLARLNATTVAPMTMNLGIGGESLEGVCARMPTLRSVHLAKAVILIAAGGLDSEDSLRCILDGIVTPILLAGHHHLVVGDGYPWTHEHNANFDGVNARWAEVCAADNACLFWPSNLDDGSGVNPRYMDEDGHHLSPLGYRRWSASLRQGLQQLTE